MTYGYSHGYNHVNSYTFIDENSYGYTTQA